MSSKRGPARRKQPAAAPLRDELAKAAAEVLNGIGAVGTRIAASAQQAISGGAARLTGGGAAGGDGDAAVTSPVVLGHTPASLRGGAPDPHAPDPAPPLPPPSSHRAAGSSGRPVLLAGAPGESGSAGAGTGGADPDRGPPPSAAQPPGSAGAAGGAAAATPPPGGPSSRGVGSYQRGREGPGGGSAAAVDDTGRPDAGAGQDEEQLAVRAGDHLDAGAGDDDGGSGGDGGGGGSGGSGDGAGAAAPPELHAVPLLQQLRVHVRAHVGPALWVALSRAQLAVRALLSSPTPRRLPSSALRLLLPLLLLLLLPAALLLGGATYQRVLVQGAAHASLAGEVAGVRAGLQAGLHTAEARAAASQEALGRRLAVVEEGQGQLGALASGLEHVRVLLAAQVGEVAALRRALDAGSVVHSIGPRPHSTSGGPNATAGTSGSSGSSSPAAAGPRAAAAPAAAAAAAAAAGAASSAAPTASALPPAAGGAPAAAAGAEDPQLRALPACHVRRVAAAAGPLLPARVAAHSPVLGDEQPLMRFHTAMSRVFARGRGGGGGSGSDGGNSHVHPLAAAVTSPAALPECLPLLAAPTPTPSTTTMSGGGGGAAEQPQQQQPGYGSVELELAEPAHVGAISFRYPPYGTWDTASALLDVQLTLHEEVSPGSAVAAAAAASGGGGSSSSNGSAASGGGAVVLLRARSVALPPLQGVECQHVRVPPPPPAGAGAAPAPAPRVRRITLRVQRIFGHAGFACVPRVLVHGRAQ